MSDRATITVVVRLNGNAVKLTPSRFTVRDNDELTIDCEVEVPLVQRDNTVGDVRIIRTILVPVVEGE